MAMPMSPVAVMPMPSAMPAPAPLDAINGQGALVEVETRFHLSSHVGNGR
jgi:hypothetical protein